MAKIPDVDRHTNPTTDLNMMIVEAFLNYLITVSMK